MFSFQFEQLNRQGEIRHDESTINALIDSGNSLFLPIYKQYIAADRNGLIWLSKGQLATKVKRLSSIHYIYLGVINQQHYFAYRLPSSEQLRDISENSDGLRNLLPNLSPQDAYLANVATGLNQWHASHQYCGFCGAETFAKESGFVRQCSDNDCAKEHFPRTDPAIIVAIIHTDKSNTERILLGRQASWPEKRYSVIAGFVEPGESLEQAVQREAMEEVGLKVSQIKYQASQPWPFPQSVMLGFNAVAENPKIELKDLELESAEWFTKQEIISAVKNGQLLLPFQYSISRSLIESWLQS